MNPKALGLLIAVISAVLFIYFCMFIGGIVFAAGTCTAKYPAGQEVTLTAKPCPGSYFVRWDGACAGQGAVCKVRMDGNKETSAVFEWIPWPYNLRLTEWEKKMCSGGGYTQGM